MERNNRTVKENILNILKERDESLGKWCTVLGEAAYKKNITLHRAINKVPYEVVVFGILPRKETPGRTEDDHIEDSEQHTTQEKQNSPNLLASELKDSSSQDDLLAPFENEKNTGQPSVADLQDLVQPSVENHNKRKYAIHENQESYNKKMKKSKNKVEDFKIDEFVSINIDR